MPSQRALLLIADISGFTRFMKVHRINLAHAQDMVSQLLESLLDAATAPLRLAKLEGDAAFFYAPLSEEAAGWLPEQVAAIRRAFLRRRRELEINRLCTCDGCVQIGQLTLKFVAHQGEVIIHKVKRWTEVGGVDVILVHRMLKNPVPIPEYVLMTEALAGQLPTELYQQGKPLEVELEGLGRTPLRYLDLNELVHGSPGEPRTSGVQRLHAWTRMTWRSLPYMVGLKKPCEGFTNLGPALGEGEPIRSLGADGREAS